LNLFQGFSYTSHSGQGCLSRSAYTGLYLRSHPSNKTSLANHCGKKGSSQEYYPNTPYTQSFDYSPDRTCTSSVGNLDNTEAGLSQNGNQSSSNTLWHF
jgi:hypothetical protein